MLEAEAVAQRRGQQARARRRADQRERRQLERHDARAGAEADGDRQLAVLHRRIERLLERARQAVDLVDEEDAAGLERGQEGGDVGLALERRAGGHDERGAELGRDDLRERRLAEPRRAGEQDVVERLAARERRLDRDRELLLQRRLADEVLEAARAQRAVELELLLDALRGLDPRMVHRRAARSAPAISASGVSSGASRSSSSASTTVKPSSTRPSRASRRGSSARVMTMSSPPIAPPRDLVAQLDDDPLGGALADPGHALEARDIAVGERADELARRAAAEHRERDLRPDRLHADQREEQVALLLGREAVQRERVVAHDQVAVQGDRPADGGNLAQRLGRHGQPVADPGGLDDDVIGAPDRDRAADECDHARARWSRISTSSSGSSGPIVRLCATAAACGAPLRWQTAIASASAACSGCGDGRQRQQRLDHPRDLVLVRAAGAADGVLDLLRRVGDDVEAPLAGGEHDDAACLADGERARDVLAEVDVLHREDRHEVLVEQLADAPVDGGQADLHRSFRAGRDDAAVEREQAPAATLDDTVAGVGGAGVDAEDDHQ